MNYPTALKECLHDLYVKGFDLAIPFSSLSFVDCVTNSPIVQCSGSETVSFAMLHAREYACSLNRFVSISVAYLKEIQGTCGTHLSTISLTSIISAIATLILSIR